MVVKPKKLNRISEVLEAKGKSQYWLAQETGITYVTVNKYFHGKVEPSLYNLFLISEALKVDGKDLINF